MTNFIITGINGQDGYYLAKLACQKFNVIGLSHQPILKHASLQNKITYYQADITDKLSMDNLIKNIKPDYFVNYAGMSNEYDCLSNTEKCYRTNALSIFYILNSLSKHAKNCKFLNSGSCEEFGDADAELIDENMPLNSQRPYGIAKIIARNIIKDFRNHNNMFCIQPWFFSHESFLRKDNFFFKKIINFAKTFKEDTDALQVGNVDDKRDWLHCYDVANAVLKMLASNTPEDYIVGSCTLNSFKDVIQEAFLAKNLIGKWNIDLEEKAFKLENGQTAVEISKDLYNLSRRKNMLKANNYKIKKELNWQPEYNFHNIIRWAMYETYE